MKKNLLVLGANGNVAHAFLIYLKNHRSLFNKLVLLSPSKFREDSFVHLKELDAKLKELRVTPKTREKFIHVLEKEKIDIVLDLSDADTALIADSVIEYGKASYICTAFCTAEVSTEPLVETMLRWLDKRRKIHRPHIFFVGMNPGVVNVWAQIGIEKFGVPREIIELEYDTSRFLKRHREKMITWSVPQFIVEMIKDPSEVMLGDHRLIHRYPNPLYNQEDLEPLFSPILKLSEYPKGCIVSHEECVTLSTKYNIPCKFIYSVNLETMTWIERLYKKKGQVTEKDLVIGDNVKDPLVGSDNIALRLDYKDKVVYYYNTVPNSNLKEMNGTIFQVVVGIYAALFTLLFHKLKNKIYFPEDLLHTFYSKFLTDNLMTEEFMFKKGKRGKLTLKSHDPHISYGKGSFLKL